MQNAGGAENHRDSHDGCRRLHTQRKHCTHHEEEQRIEEIRVVEASEEGANRSVCRRVLHHAKARLLERRKPKEKETDTEQELAQDSLLVHINEYDADEERRINEVRDVEREPEAHDPCGHRRTNMGTEDDRNRLH